jgi:hypothetical protein
MTGIGAIACEIDGKRQIATAFLVGRFDIAITTANVFLGARAARPADCAYLTAGPAGDIRDRIPLLEIRSRWQQVTDANRSPAMDVAVVRLARDVTLARRTLSLKPWTRNTARIRMVGFPTHLVGDAFKREAEGTLYAYREHDCAQLSHDAVAAGFASGAPLFDNDGIVRALHTRPVGRRCKRGLNVAVPIDAWVLRTVREEIANAIRDGTDGFPTVEAPSSAMETRSDHSPGSAAE